MQYLLHIDTSSDYSAIALSSMGILLAYNCSETHRNHAATLNNDIKTILDTQNLSLNQVEALDICGGPGSYTGLRIGMATAKGICYALSKPLIMTDKLTLLAFQIYEERIKNYNYYISILKAREKEYFIAIFDENFFCISEAKHIFEVELENILQAKENVIIITNCSIEITKFINKDYTYIVENTSIKPLLWCKFGFIEYNCNRFVNIFNAEPFYLKQVYTHKPLTIN